MWRRVAVSRTWIELTGLGTEVTLNGIAQGFAADRALAALAANGVRHALVDAGEIGIMGRLGRAVPGSVGLGFDGRCVATSIDGTASPAPDPVHHLVLDPRSGRSPSAFQRVTVLAESGLEADALSTAVFVAGLERGMDLMESRPGADALFVLRDGETVASSSFPRAHGNAF